jgi:putative flippase GtrA
MAPDELAWGERVAALSEGEMESAAPPPARIGFARRVIGYCLVGGLSTLVSYVLTLALKSLVGINAAAVIAWVAAVLTGFVINRRVTFGLIGAEKRWLELALFTFGALMQLLLTLIGYAIMLGRLHMNFNVAFAINIVTTTIFGFTYINLVVFRRAR